MDLTKVKYMHFIGIGGIGMSALARYFNQQGIEVSGYDRTASPLTKELEAEGMTVYYEEDLSLIPEKVKSSCGTEELVVVYTPAVPVTFAEREYFKEKHSPVLKRAELLGLLSENLETIAVAGTHGKTTTTSLLSAILEASGRAFVAFVGGINENSNSNLVLRGKPEILLAEADEYDRSFLHLKAAHAVLTSLDPDHLDIYGDEESMVETYETFCKGVRNDLWVSTSAGDILKRIDGRSYGLKEGLDAYADNIRPEGNTFLFDFHCGEVELKDLSLALPGFHNIENCTGAIALSLELGIEAESIREAISNYKGVRRRFEFHINRPDLIYIDDYAHHPSEIDAVVSSIREMYPEKRITGLFQPHLFSRTRDFADGFAQSLEKLDELLLMDIYPAREEPIAGIDSAWLLSKISMAQKALVERENVLQALEERHPEIILTIGAGDIDQLVTPIRQKFEAS